MKPLEKNRARRYQTAHHLASDVRRYLAREPITARPPSRVYRVRRLVQRNKVAFAASAVIFVAIVGGLLASLWQAHRAEREAARAKRESGRANAALAELRKAAPAFAEQARALVVRERIEEAIERLEYAAQLEPEVAAHVAAKGDLRQSQLRLAEAASAYRAALQLDPRHTHAQANLALCERLLAVQGAAAQLPREGLAELFAAMQREQRSAGELLAMARLLREEKDLALRVWLERLATLPIPPERPLAERLKVQPDGWLALDLSGTDVGDLSALAGMPLAVLDLTGCAAITELRPLRGLPVKTLRIRGTKVTDLAPLSTLRDLQELDLPAAVRDLAALRGLRLRALVIRESGVTDLAPLRGMPLTSLYMQSSQVSDLSPLAGMPLQGLEASNLPATDFSPLAGAPLEWRGVRRESEGSATVLGRKSKVRIFKEVVD